MRNRIDSWWSNLSKKRRFFVKWLNSFEFENEWTKKINLKNCKELLIVYKKNEVR